MRTGERAGTRCGSCGDATRRTPRSEESSFGRNVLGELDRLRHDRQTGRPDVGWVWMGCGTRLVSLIQAQRDSNEES
jgi:hypothetical protein